jgi:2-polyprenyl-6-methoxyphenol hydroxylase-like FAD-dependent oxidoreductase
VRTLIIGAGLAGLTLAGRLCQQGRTPVLVERSASPEGGYAIGLYPLGGCVLHGLGTYELLRERALVLDRYELASESGQVLQAFDMSVLTAAAGPLLMVSRSDLVRLLEASCSEADLRRGVTVTSLVQAPDAVQAVGFLPTAAVGASSAMRAAAGLADELSRADAATVPLALKLYEKRCRGTVERHQTESRRLARVMFVRAPLLARARDEMVRRYPARLALSEIINSTRRPF